MLSVPVDANFQRLLDQEDTDSDGRITIRDTGPKRFQLISDTGESAEVAGTYALSNLLQELAAARLGGLHSLQLNPAELDGKPVERLSRTIRERCWGGLTRHITPATLAEVLHDVKGDGKLRCYVPATDPIGLSFYQKQQQLLDFDLRILPTPAPYDPLLALNSAPGLLALASDQSGAPLPYAVPGGRFNEMYGWDSYFIGLGLLQDGQHALVRCLLEHFRYQLQHYGKILNANRTYYLTRSQPPFMPALLRAYLAHAPEGTTRAWIHDSLRLAQEEYDSVWMGPTRLVPSTGLSRYFCAGVGMPPETAMRFYGQIMAPYAARAVMSVEEYRRAYQNRKLVHPELDAYFSEDRAVRESGHDTSYRLENCCTRLCTVDLNSLLGRFELDMAQLTEEHGAPEGGRSAEAWRELAARRRELLNQLCWNQQAGQFFDYDWVAGRQRPWESCTNLFPLWAGLASSQQAEHMVNGVLSRLELAGGVASGTEASRGPLSETRTARQWDFPYGWAPHQMLLWEGLKSYGYAERAGELAFKWLRMITQNAIDFNGVLPEKFDVGSASHEVFAEYQNVGADFSYLTQEGFGWTNASYQVGLTHLSSAQRQALDALRCSKA